MGRQLDPPYKPSDRISVFTKEWSSEHQDLNCKGVWNMQELWFAEMVTSIGNFLAGGITFFWYMLAGWLGVTLP